VYADAYMIPICSHVWYLCCILKLYQIVGSAQATATPATTLRFEDHLRGEDLWTSLHDTAYICWSSVQSHPIIQYIIISSHYYWIYHTYIYIYISHYYQYPQSWDDHLNMNGMFKSYNPINKSHDFTMILHQLLVGGAITILKNMTSSMGRMTSHILWNIKNDWNHQPD